MEDIGLFTSYAAVQDYLFSLKACGVKFGIDRMGVLVEALDHPERRYPVIHVAGTNGKGSVSAMLDAVLHAAGWRTGLYTSPHLVKLGERVQVDRRLLTEQEIVAYTDELRPVAGNPALFSAADHPSFFEFMTAMAFLQFARRQVDVALVEVGLGGRLDATNVVQPEVAAITSIGLDHCDMLGDRIELIAEEKAGIIKPGCPVVLGRMPAVAEEVIRAIAAGARRRSFRCGGVWRRNRPLSPHQPGGRLPALECRNGHAHRPPVAGALATGWRDDSPRPDARRLAGALAADDVRRPAVDPRRLP